ncbi:ribose 5-phosphate isomerase B [Anaerosinus gibii]|uniref:Ribose 5-phosphate isomerase B n=1 Tax=Selenobaculum gibii TaxID=3054208 RepID=A0A9Y2AHZ8_9FIRM|nr:ribose 5-phosphate isomerase B [Selenobaculum gbiensis]WIW70454.1 ribose 5-phosphate isomerase B [Selenobaculum gbiensis]
MIALGCDHGGYELKEAIKKYLDKQGVAYKDFGTNSIESVDYPEYAEAVANSVASKEAEKGILVCGTGVGMSIAANKVPGIRAALISDCFSAKATREHNDSNILCLGGRVLGENLALMIVEIWLNTAYIGAHHAKRLEMIQKMEDKAKK